MTFSLLGVFFKSRGVDGCLNFMHDVLNIQTMFKSIPTDEISDRNPTVQRVQHGTRSCYSDFPKAHSAARRLERGDSDEQRINREQSEVNELYNRGRLKEVEKILKYGFRDKSHLVQATTHLSYIGNQGITGCYQEYEFLGDAILDFLVTLHVYHSSSRLSPGQLTSIKSALVNNNVFSFHVIKHGLHKFISHSSPALSTDLNEFLGRVTDEHGILHEDLYEVTCSCLLPKGILIFKSFLKEVK